MKFMRLLALMVLFLPQWVLATELADQLRSGDHVLLIRHAEAPGGGDPANLRLGDCSTQRNLDQAGRQQAQALGVWLKKQGVDQARLFTSPWCRCQDTATLLELGPATTEPSLASFFNEPQKADASTAALRAFMVRTLAATKGKALILVTHHVNILALVGENVASGEMVLARVDRQGRVLSYQRFRAP